MPGFTHVHFKPVNIMRNAIGGNPSDDLNPGFVKMLYTCRELKHIVCQMESDATH